MRCAQNILLFSEILTALPVGSSIPLQDFKSTFRARVSNHNGELDTRAIEHIQNNGFTDLWKSKNPDIEVGTYPTPLGEKNAEYPFPVRIDYLFGSEFFTRKLPFLRCFTRRTLRSNF